MFWLSSIFVVNFYAMRSNRNCLCLYGGPTLSCYETNLYWNRCLNQNKVWKPLDVNENSELYWCMHMLKFDVSEWLSDKLPEMLCRRRLSLLSSGCWSPWWAWLSPSPSSSPSTTTRSGRRGSSLRTLSCCPSTSTCGGREGQAWGELSESGTGRPVIELLTCI